MATLGNLLASRSALRRRGIERQESGQIFYFSHTSVSGTCNYTSCCFTWTSPGTGTAIVELWGASGSGALMCCCSGAGIPGNPGAYSKATVLVCAGSVICGATGCSPHGNCLCYPGRSNCSYLTIFNASSNPTLIAEGGFGGYQNCSTSTAHYCCLVAAGFAHTLTNTFCGILCNVGGPNSATFANASGGDTNIQGGISCLRTYDCCQYWKCNHEMIIATSPGIFSSCCSTCFRYMRSEFPGYGIVHAGKVELSTAMASAKGSFPHRHSCWNSNQPCGCYEWDGCAFGTTGVPGPSGATCPGVRSGGLKGGHGAVKITFYS